MRQWLRHLLKVSPGVNRVEKDIAERGRGWDGLELGNWYKAYVVAVPDNGELTTDGRPELPVCRVKNDEGNFMGRYIMTEIDRPVKLGQPLMVLLTTAQASVLFATAYTGMKDRSSS